MWLVSTVHLLNLESCRILFLHWLKTSIDWAMEITSVSVSFTPCWDRETLRFELKTWIWSFVKNVEKEAEKILNRSPLCSFHLTPNAMLKVFHNRIRLAVLQLPHRIVSLFLIMSIIKTAPELWSYNPNKRPCQDSWNWPSGPVCAGEGVEGSRYAVPAPVARAVAEATSHQSLQGGQRRAAQLLSTRTPAAPGHVGLARCRPPAQSQQLPAPTSSRPPSPPVQPGPMRKKESKTKYYVHTVR